MERAQESKGKRERVTAAETYMKGAQESERKSTTAREIKGAL